MIDAFVMALGYNAAGLQEESVQMNKTHIAPGVRWIIFAGAPMVLFALMACTYKFLAQAVGERKAPYLGLGIAGIIQILSLVLYDHIPKRLIFPIGIVGWMTTLLLMYWFSMYGPSAF